MARDDRRKTWQADRRATAKKVTRRPPVSNRTVEEPRQRQPQRQAQQPQQQQAHQQYGQDAGAIQARRVSVQRPSKLRRPSNSPQRQGGGSPSRTLSREELGLPTPTNGIARWFAMVMKQGGIRRIRQRFVLDIQPYRCATATTTAFAANPNLNRYEDVPCYDATRVRIQKTPDGNDYIHANHVTGAAFPIICAQGPIEDTIERFWIMALEQNCQIIIQLCQYIEEGKEKCTNYLPLQSAGVKNFGTVTVRMLEKTRAMVANPDIRRTRLEVTTPDGQRLEVFHLMYNAWPDHSVPYSSTSYRQLRNYVQKLALEKRCTVLVHCSAGIGRTGTYAAVEIAIYELVQKDSECQVPVILRALRNQRALAVQTDLQYLFIHRAVVDAAVETKRLPPATVRAFNDEYEILVERKRKERQAILNARNNQRD